MPDEQVQAPEPAIQLGDVATAEKLIGLSFTPDERELMLDNVNRWLKEYEKLRALHLENSVAPPLYFDPRSAAERSPNRYTDAPRPVRQSLMRGVSRPANLEDVAFYPLTHLAELVRTRQVTSLELTHMYLDRLKRYDPLLHCVVTLTEDLALEQAKRADAEIQAVVIVARCTAFLGVPRICLLLKATRPPGARSLIAIR